MHKLQLGALPLALLSILFWSTMGSAFKLTLQFTNPPTLLLIASLTACIFLFIMQVGSKSGLNLSSVSRKQIGSSALMGLFNPMLYYLVLFEAYRRIPAQEGVALNYIWPLVLVIFSMIFLKQKESFSGIIAIIISFTGTLIIVTHGNLSEFSFSDPIGVALALGSAFFWASFWILNMKDSREALPKMFLNFCFGTLYILLYMLISGRFVAPPWQGIVGGMYIGIFEMGLTFVLWLMALQKAKNTTMLSNLVFISPFLSLFMVSLFVGEKILFSTWVGLAVIVAGILLQQYLHIRKSMEIIKIDKAQKI